MLEFSKKFLFYSLITISSISFINLIFLYWFPIQIPLSSYSAINLMVIAYTFNAYYLLPISFLVCILMFFTALSFLKKKIILPIFLFMFLLFDSFFIAHSFFDAWFKNSYFIFSQAIQLIINIIICIFFCIYLAKRNSKSIRNKERGWRQGDG